ncbi:DUF1810 domain-containing protein [Parafrankia sp. BMG5.11]|uniref:DUF1810 domain-containing protein n=1 Tax=Parafrankia sp. BMG5.11 TaxID=222540 RepID=UPI00103DBBED|nr:DUF1810 domain-containing protein [Parafrankia sp. BMG5.11]TCJ38343.1 DUF1810 family protein [Parafrankia sp. BMG5.11]
MASLDRFVTAQAGGVFERALAELRAGSKHSHWIWFVFPQIAGLGRSEMARYYALADLREAAAYLAHPLLGERLDAATDAMLSWAGKHSAEAILGTIDAVKFRSSMTLFGAAAPENARFAAALAAFFVGEPDRATLERL